MKIIICVLVVLLVLLFSGYLFKSLKVLLAIAVIAFATLGCVYFYKQAGVKEEVDPVLKQTKGVVQPLLKRFSLFQEEEPKKETFGDKVTRSSQELWSGARAQASHLLSLVGTKIENLLANVLVVGLVIGVPSGIIFLIFKFKQS